MSCCDDDDDADVVAPDPTPIVAVPDNLVDVIVDNDITIIEASCAS